MVEGLKLFLEAHGIKITALFCCIIWVYWTYSGRENGRFLTFDYKIDFILPFIHTIFTINGSFERKLNSAHIWINFYICLTPKFCIRRTSFKNFELNRILKACVSAYDFGKFGKSATITFLILQFRAFKPSQSFCTGSKLYFDMHIVGVAMLFECLNVNFNDDLFFTRNYFSSGTIDLARICQGHSYGQLILYFWDYLCTIICIYH